MPTGTAAAQPDITLRLDSDGVIRDAKFSRAFNGESEQTLLDRPWVDTVGAFGGDMVRRMIEDAQSTGVSAFRQVTQCFPSGFEVPMEYTAVRLGDRSGLVAIGKNLQAVSDLQSRLISAQIAMERDYWKVRELETRYRLLFDASNDAVLVIRAADLQVLEANPAAIRALGAAPLERPFLAELAAADRQPFQAMLERAREQGRSPAIVIHIGAARESWAARASLMTGQPGQVFLLQLARTAALHLPPGRPVTQAVELTRGDTSAVDNLIDRTPDAFVLVDREGIVQRANQAFCDLVEVASPGGVVGKPLRRWLCRPGADATVLLGSIESNRSVRRVSTALTGELGLETEVEISGIGDVDLEPRTFGLLMRDVARTGSPAPESVSRFPLDWVADRIGTTPLQEVVREATESVERHCIAAALGRSGGNRTAAAAHLGLSRQSLYVKMNRYGLDVENKKARHDGG